LQQYPHLPLIAWSDSEFMRGAFAKIFTQHNRLVNEYNIWTKSVDLECIRRSFAYYFDEIMEQNPLAFSQMVGGNYFAQVP
jgi:hypothetical protein